ncbi:hypothetical protein EDB85DRAFT_2151252 [Lactarius pseudohatsudake]|nr:hypothetical protein EDB85DRAFT_2151252 [Lactarius pseudohatsudake]
MFVALVAGSLDGSSASGASIRVREGSEKQVNVGEKGQCVNARKHVSGERWTNEGVTYVSPPVVASLIVDSLRTCSSLPTKARVTRP